MRQVFIIFYVYCAMIVSAFGQEAPVYASDAQWQLTFDVIRAKVDGLLQENNRLTAEYGSLLNDQTQLQQAIADQSAKNEAMQKFLKERDGKTDQQMRIEELEQQIKAKKAQLPGRTQEANGLRGRAAIWQSKIDAKRLRISEQELGQKAAAKPESVPAPAPRASSGDPELDALRRDLESQKVEEVALESKLAAANGQDPDPQIIALQKQVQMLLQEKKQLLQKVEAPKPRFPQDRFQYTAVRAQKNELEKKITGYESAINEMKNSTAWGLSWSIQRKQLVHEVAWADAKNGQLRAQINNLREDIGILRDQVANFERRQQ